jgi:CheY-like chemotaxis protein
MDQALKTEFRARVLVVDDEHAIAETLSLILTKSGFETAVAHDGRDAVAKARSWRPDAIVSDVVMPVMNGIEAAIQILAFLPGCKIVLLSGQAATSDLVKNAALKGHYFQVMAKPVHPTELLRELNGL